MRQDLSAFLEYDFAHRGLFRSGSAVEENTLPAFEAAVAGGFGIELDVRATFDDNAVVFHDETLERLTESHSPVSEIGSRRLHRFRVGNSSATIPHLIDALDRIGGAVPVLVEIKRSGRENLRRYGTAIRRAFEGYTGPFALISYDADIISWFRKHWPGVRVGLVFGENSLGGMVRRYRLRRALATIDPEILAVHTSIVDHVMVTSWHGMKRGLLMTWTVRDEATADAVRPKVDAIIFEDPSLIREDLITGDGSGPTHSGAHGD